MPESRPSPARLAAAHALLRVEREGAYSNIALRAVLRQTPLDAQSRAFAASLVYGTLERAITLDYLLAPHLRAPVGDCEVRVVLRMGLYELLFRRTPARAAVDESVEVCRALRKKSACGLVNAVLRAAARKDGDVLDALPPAVRFGVSQELYGRLVSAYGEDAAARFFEDALRPAPRFVRVNTLRTSRDALAAHLAEEGVTAEPAALPDALALGGMGDLEELPAFREGLFHVQDLSSQFCARSLGAAPGMEVLDACAAPGGKTFTAAEEMGGEGRVVACDLHPHKIRLIRDGARRLGLENVIPVVQDSREYNSEYTAFDRVLCDVPCSGLGGLRRRPELRTRTPRADGTLGSTQYKILETSSHYVKEGGVLVYSTCTLDPDENERVVERFLSEHPAFACEWQRTFLPGADWAGDGFYLARMRRGAAR